MLLQTAGERKLPVAMTGIGKADAMRIQRVAATSAIKVRIHM